MSDSTPSRSGIGFVGLLTIVFVTLKLCDVIDWSWWWVLSPIWISAALTLTILMIALIVLGLAIQKKNKTTRRGGL